MKILIDSEGRKIDLRGFKEKSYCFKGNISVRKTIKAGFEIKPEIITTSEVLLLWYIYANIVKSYGKYIKNLEKNNNLGELYTTANNNHHKYHLLQSFMYQLLNATIQLENANSIQIIRFFHNEGKAISTSPTWQQSFKDFKDLNEQKIIEEEEFLRENFPKLTMHII